MTDPSHDKLSEVFLHACDLTGVDRDSYLEKECGPDGSMRTQIEDMLQADEASPSGLSRASVKVNLQALATETVLPSKIGPYTIKRKIGVGGMGIVYEAEQEKPNRSVALKVLRWVDDPRQLARFELEAEVLGWLQHPAIAHIHGAGQSELPDGPRPWIAMEYVDGMPIDQFIAQHALDESAMLDLLQRLLDGIAHAHSKGVVHRDLKPANILVDQTGAPRIVDFGVARLASTENASVQTEAGDVVGTLAYMSPEQVGGDPRAVDTQSDIYALGAIAYELLSGKRPLAPKGASVTEAMRSIAEGRPKNLQSLAPISQDLSTIVHTALARDKSKRYPTAEAFAEDIRRYLANEVILARPPSALYQLRCFGRRNRVATLAMCAALALLVGGGGLSTYLYLKGQKANTAKDVALEKADDANAEARKQASLAERGLLFYGNILSQADSKHAGRNATLAELLENASLAVPQQFEDSPILQIQFLNTFSSAYQAAGKNEQALKDAELAVQLLEDQVTNKPALASQTYMGYAGILGELKRFDEGIEALEKAADALSSHNDRNQAYLLARAYQGLGMSYTGKREYQKSLDALQSAFDLLDQADHTVDLPGWLLHAKACALEGLERMPEAIETMEEAVAYTEEMDLQGTSLWVHAKFFLGDFLIKSDEFDAALEELIPLPAIEESLNGKTDRWVRILKKLEKCYSSQDNHAKIVETLERALASKAKPDATTPIDQYHILYALGQAYLELEEVDKAYDNLQAAIQVVEGRTDQASHKARFNTYNFLSQIARGRGNKILALEYANLSCLAGDIPMQPELHPGKRVLGYRYLAFMHTESGDWLSGAKHFLMALEMSIELEADSDAQVLKNRATLATEGKWALTKSKTPTKATEQRLDEIIAEHKLKLGNL